LEKLGVWEELNLVIRTQVRRLMGKEDTASLMIMDSQSAKTAEGGENAVLTVGKRSRDANEP
jgi:transposase